MTLLLLGGCIEADTSPLEKAVQVLDNATRTLENAPDDWRRILAEARDQLTADARSLR